MAVIAGLLPEPCTSECLRERMEEWQQSRHKGAGLVKGLGLLDSTTLVMGSMIGSGIFIVSADISRQVQSPGLLILTWLVAALLTIIAALSYGELAAAMPHAGGQYVYLREAFGPLSGFLFGWTIFWSSRRAPSPPSPLPSPNTAAFSSPGFRPKIIWPAADGSV